MHLLPEEWSAAKWTNVIRKNRRLEGQTEAWKIYLIHSPGLWSLHEEGQLFSMSPSHPRWNTPTVNHFQWRSLIWRLHFFHSVWSFQLLDSSQLSVRNRYFMEAEGSPREGMSKSFKFYTNTNSKLGSTHSHHRKFALSRECVNMPLWLSDTIFPTCVLFCQRRKEWPKKEDGWLGWKPFDPDSSVTPRLILG